MSTAFYKFNSVPKLIARFSHEQKSVAVWTTTCIVNNFGKNQDQTSCNVLINPSNPELSGVSNFPYFPRGGPVPTLKPKDMHKDWQPLGYVSNWGGMEVGEGMLYPVSVIDGLVHQLGGPKLALECKMINLMKGGCPVGKAVETTSGSEELRSRFERIIHVTPPFFKYHENGDPVQALQQCYRSALALAFSNHRRNEYTVACPLIGAGARGFPYDIAIAVATSEARKWLREVMTEHPSHLYFGIPDIHIAEHFVKMYHELDK